jgi:putative flippase GtrA|tara:strand:+ start:2177 stop:2608 length:432 start_codon:yes stop_codon:yes gene_type:complete
MSFSKLINILLHQKPSRYLLVGAYNTVFGYLFFVLIFHYFSSTISHYLLLGLCHLIGTTHNFFSYKFFVFKEQVSNFRNYLKFNLVYVFTFLLNLGLFIVLTKIMNWNLYLSQALIISVIAVLGYILNKYFSFSNKPIFSKNK